MNDDIMELSNGLIYKGKLKSGSEFISKNRFAIDLESKKL